MAPDTAELAAQVALETDLMGSVRDANGSIHNPDGTIDHPDGTTEFNGYLFDPVDWNELDPPAGSPDAVTISHEQVMAEMAAKYGFKY